MKLSIDLGRWTATKAALAVAGLLGIAGVVGSAVAMSPVLTAPVKWAGGWEGFLQMSTGYNELYAVPAGSNLIISDLWVSNPDSTIKHLSIHTSGAGSNPCGQATFKTRAFAVVIPPSGTVVLPMQTGIGYAAGQRVCLFGTGLLYVNARGFLFRPAPTS